MPSPISSLAAKAGVGFIGAAAVLGLLLPKALPAFPVVSDSLDYQMIAQGLVERHTYLDISAEQLLYPPGYPVLLALAFWIQGGVGYGSVHFLQTLLVGISAWLAFLLLRKLGQRPPIALGGGAVTLFWPYLLLYAHLVASEIPYVALLVAGVTAFIHGWERPGWRWPAGTGILFGLAILVRPVALFLPLGLLLFFAGLMLIRWLPRNDALLRFAGIAWLASLLTIAPWVAAVSAYAQRFVPVASNLSFVLKKSNRSLAYLPEHAGQEGYRASLGEVAQAKLRNAVFFWDPGAGGDNMAQLAARHPAAGGLIWLYKIGYFAILLLAAFGIWRERRRPGALVLSAVILYVWAVHTVLFPFPRYTLPILPFVIALAALGTGRLAYASPPPHLHPGQK